MQGINYWAILLSTIVVFLLGGIWYSEKLFGKVWQRESATTKNNGKCSHGPVAFIVSFLYTLIAAFAFAYVLSDQEHVSSSILFGLIVGVCFVATSLGTNYLF